MPIFDEELIKEMVEEELLPSEPHKLSDLQIRKVAIDYCIAEACEVEPSSLSEKLYFQLTGGPMSLTLH